MKLTNKEEYRKILEQSSIYKDKSWYADLVDTEKKLPVFWERSSQGSYTNHGKTHIDSVERFVGDLIGKERLDNYISPQEFFILLLGVFCHDLGMTRFSMIEKDTYRIERSKHNVYSYQFVMDRENQKNICVPDESYYKPIALLCLGHRDYEDDNGNVIHTLSDKCSIGGKDVMIKDVIRIDDANIHLRYLAAILRLADELDLSPKRAPESLKMLFKGFVPDSTIKIWDGNQIIDYCEIEPKGRAETIIHIIPNYDKISDLSSGVNSTEKKEDLLKMLFLAKEKIEKEIEKINDITFNKKTANDLIEVQFSLDIKYDYDVVSPGDYDEYKRAKEKQLKEQNHIGINRGIDSIDSQNNGLQEIISPRTILSGKIEEFRRDRNLLETGRFVYSFGSKDGNEEKEKNEYTQFFINTQLLLTNRETLDCITDIFEEQFKDKSIDCVIGIGKAGIILAPNLSLKLGCNSSYVICGWEGTSSIPQEESTSVIRDANNILVLLDVISTGTATRQGIEKIIEIKERGRTPLENIYIGTIFCTNREIKEILEKEDKVKEMYFIRDDFQFKTYKYKEYMDEKNEEFRKGFELLPLRKK